MQSETEKKILQRYQDGEIGDTELSFLLRHFHKWHPDKISTAILEKERLNSVCCRCACSPENKFKIDHSGWWRSKTGNWWCTDCCEYALVAGEVPANGFCEPEFLVDLEPVGLQNSDKAVIILPFCLIFVVLMTYLGLVFYQAFS